MKYIYLPIIALTKELNTTFEEEIDEKLTPEYWKEMGLDRMPEEFEEKRKEYLKEQENKFDNVPEDHLGIVITRVVFEDINSWYLTKRKYKNQYITNVYTDMDTYSTPLSPDEIDGIMSEAGAQFYGKKYEED